MWVTTVRDGLQPARDALAAAFTGTHRLDVLDHAQEGVPGVVVVHGTEEDPPLVEALVATAAAPVIVATPAAAACPWELLAAGAADVLELDDECAATVVARIERWLSVERIRRSELVAANLIGNSSTWTRALHEVIAVARFSDRPLLLSGESGTGKELIGRLVHTLDQRDDKGPLITVDCTTIVPSLSGSELFGHVKGAYTGATTDRSGAFALADRGTLFLDEIGELPLGLQAELLRVVQEGTYKRVGSNEWQHASFRLVCATHRDLLRMVSEGTFRADLYHRIAAVTVTLPPLRDRRSDIVPLFQHHLARELGASSPPRLDPIVQAHLVTRPYPGNVRDLKQLAARVAYRHVGSGAITVGDLPMEERPCSAGDDGRWWHRPGITEALHAAVAQHTSLRDLKERVADLAIRAAIELHDGNVQRAALQLQVTDRTIQMRRASWVSSP